MTTTELKAKIEAAARLALADYANEQGLNTAGTYIYAIRDLQAMSYDKPLPHIYCEELSMRKNLGTGIVEWPGINLAFLDQDSADTSADQMEAIKDRMERLADLFQQNLLADDDELSEDVVFDLAPISKVNAGMFSGYAASLTISSVIGC